VYKVEVDGHTLTLSEQFISYGGNTVSIDGVEGIHVARTDTYLNGAWVNGKRVISIRGDNQFLRIDCSRAFPNRNSLEESFGSVFEPIWAVVGNRLIRKLLDKLANNQPVRVGEILVVRDGVWVDGSWRFLWWKAKPKLIPWNDLKIFRNEGTLFLSSVSDVRLRSEVKFNETENSIVLDGAIRLLFHKNNWKKLGRSF
jgi:hypothetical protein